MNRQKLTKKAEDVFKTLSVGMSARHWFAMVLIALIVGDAFIANCQSPYPVSVAVNGPVNSIVVDDEYTYIGGNFTYVGLHSGYGVKLSSASNLTFSKLPIVNILIKIPFQMAKLVGKMVVC